MSKDAKNVPALRFKGFSDAWEKRKVSDYLSESLIPGSNGMTAKKITVKLWGKGIVPKREIYRGSKSTKYYRRKAGQIMYGKLDFLHAAFGIVPQTLDGWESTIDSPAFDVNAELANSGFLLSVFLRKSFYLNQGIIANGSRKAKRINQKTFLEMPLRVPFKEEQDRICLLLSKTNNLIAATQGKLDQLELVKKALLQHLFDQSMRFKGYSDPWEKRKLGELGDTYTGLSGKSKLDFGHGKARYVTYMNVFKNPISDPKGTDAIEFDDKQNQVRKNDVFFTTSSETPDEVGMSSVWPADSKNVYLNSFCFGYRFLEQETLNFSFLAQQFRSPSFRKKMILLAQGISRYNISKKKVLKIPIFLPTLTEQNRIGTFLTNLDDLIAATQSKLSGLESLKKALLQGLFI